VLHCAENSSTPRERLAHRCGMIIKPKIRGFICITAHPDGCAAHVREQIEYVRRKVEEANIQHPTSNVEHASPPVSPRSALANAQAPTLSFRPGFPKRVLVIGASTGYGLASRIVPAFAGGAATIGVFFEKPGEEGRCGSAGWYNSVAFEREAHAAGLYAKSINGDAFSDAVKEQVIALIKADLGQVDAVIYSLASPRRTHPKTGAVHKSTLKPLGAAFTNKTVDTDKGAVSEITIEPANDAEIADTVAVMGGEDWEMWIDALDAAGALAPGVVTVAYSYIGPDLTWAIYRNGTIGRAKEHLEETADRITAKLAKHEGHAWVSVNKALVTQASSAIPVVPLYISLLYKVMKAKGLHEGCIEQIYRLFAERLAPSAHPQPDEEGRIRIDDWEMREDVQTEVAKLWPQVTTETLPSLSDIAGYRAEFLRLFGFGLEGVNYDAEAEPLQPMPSAS
jgi:enoyl-[acyl-carrier protein] reductase/trans-2-enoyl-CoA reductase (NAD+)